MILIDTITFTGLEEPWYTIWCITTQITGVITFSQPSTQQLWKDTRNNSLTRNLLQRKKAVRTLVINMTLLLGKFLFQISFFTFCQTNDHCSCVICVLLTFFCDWSCCVLIFRFKHTVNLYIKSSFTRTCKQELQLPVPAIRFCYVLEVVSPLFKRRQLGYM